jgi:glutathione S-transferase
MYELYYWPSIQGRGEFVRLALEESAAEYVDVARNGDEGMRAMMALIEDGCERPPYAPPILKCGDELIAQTANILAFLGPRHGLVPHDEAGRRWVHQLQLTLADFVAEIHDTHHPVSSALYYEDQKPEAKRKAADVTGRRMPKYLGYFERVLERSGSRWLAGPTPTYADLSLFQLVSGLRYAFPRAMARHEPKCPRLAALHLAVQQRPRIAAYLASARRLAFNEQDVFRHYAELDD